MTILSIYHNPKCSKSRQALEILQKSGKQLRIIEYLKTGLEIKIIETLITRSAHKPGDFLRKKEKEFADYKDADLSLAHEVATILHNCPKLLERPVVTMGHHVIIARPPERVEELLL